MAEELVARVSSVDLIRFTNSGSEATSLAVEIARAATGRRKFVMARGGYHGSMPEFEPEAGKRPGSDTLLAGLDILLLCAVFAVICRSFDLRVACTCAALLGLGYGWRYLYVGAFLRLDWMVAIAIGLCLLRRRR